MSKKVPKFEFIDNDQRSAIITQRLRSAEQDVLNAQMELVMAEAVAANTPETPGASASATERTTGRVETYQANLDQAVARLEALRALRDSDKKGS